MKKLLADLLVIAFNGGGFFLVGMYGNYITRKKHGPRFNQHIVLQFVSFIYIIIALVIYIKTRDISLLSPISALYLIAIAIDVLFFWLLKEITKRL